jgi:3-hydroxyacyl-[acyl-carrier-protein] dehydratase
MNHGFDMPINIGDIMKRIPHRYPMLLIDKVVACTLNQCITAIKNVTINEHFFVGHFEKYPVMPGVLIIESMAQAAGILVGLSRSDGIDDLYFLGSVNNTRFKRQVIPGDVLRIEVNIINVIKNAYKCKIEAFVADNIAAYAELTIVRRVAD